jgi:hypothetical protein
LISVAGFVLIGAVTVLFIGCTVESPMAPSDLATFGGSGAVAQWADFFTPISTP